MSEKKPKPKRKPGCVDCGKPGQHKHTVKGHEAPVETPFLICLPCLNIRMCVDEDS